ncbi:MAG TPA: hypothetical protein VLV87_05520 [Gammaproteobacteria bacterium]|nr:hypothetical protein [Gammaproteobacteria bacterium]
MKGRLEGMGFGAFYGLLLAIVVWIVPACFGIVLPPLIVLPIVIAVMGAIGFILGERFVENFGGLIFWTMMSL